MDSWEAIDTLSAADILQLLENRGEMLLNLLKHVAIDGKTPSELISKLTAPLQILLAVPKDHDFSDIKGDVSLLIDRVLQIIQSFIPQDVLQKLVNDTTNTLCDTGQQAAKDIREDLFLAAEKLQLIYQYILAKGIKVSIENKPLTPPKTQGINTQTQTHHQNTDEQEQGWVSSILGDDQHGLIAKLPNQKDKALCQKLVNGDWLKPP